jgi:hypothetical protein
MEILEREAALKELVTARDEAEEVTARWCS